MSFFVAFEDIFTAAEENKEIRIKELLTSITIPHP